MKKTKIRKETIRGLAEANAELRKSVEGLVQALHAVRVEGELALKENDYERYKRCKDMDHRINEKLGQIRFDSARGSKTSV